MNHLLKYACTALAIAAAASAVQAQTFGPKTRDEVRRELAEAIRDGTIPQGEAGLTPRELTPWLYPPPQASNLTRAQVRAEVDEARRNGALLAAGEAGRPSELFPQPVVIGKTREQVRAELAEAQRTGDIVASGESGMTLRELYPGAYPQPVMPVYAGSPTGMASTAARQ